MDPSSTNHLVPPATTEAHTAHAANPTPSHGPNHDHPPYAEMITAAITALKERNGSSRQAIAKYIERVYSDLPPTHSALLTHHLKRLKINGQLVMVKHSYKLPRSEFPSDLAAATISPPPSTTGRKRGRPPKPKTNLAPNGAPNTEPNVGSNDEPNAGPVLQNKKRGRPPKANTGFQWVQEGGGPMLNLVAPQSETVEKGLDDHHQKTKLVTGVMLGPGVVKRAPGRPRKTQFEPIAVPHLATDPPRPRGRPKKAPGWTGVDAVSSGGKRAVGKRRGRRPQVGGAQMPKRTTGRPAGRARKNTAYKRVEPAGSPQWMVDYGYVKNKLDHIQSRIKQSVGLLKPHLMNENAISVVDALQELEVISTMDIIGAPSHVVQVQHPSNVESDELEPQNQEPHLQ